MSDLQSEPQSFRDVLYTIDSRGRRRWVYPADVRGRFRRRREIVASVLLLIYLGGPWIRFQGRQAFHFDIMHRRFTLFGVEFWATDTLYLMLVLSILGVSLFLFTSLVGRVWCGWACPQTVFLEFVFRPVERLIEGGPVQRKRLDAQPWNAEKIRKKGLKFLVFACLSWVIANTFLAYIYGAGPVLEMMKHSPAEQPFPFALTVFVMCAFLFEFGWFREQFCTVLCPYARFQSVMLDRGSLVIGYDARRGEPRGKPRAANSAPGDCVDCGSCVRVCPTGIDIRNGLQLECVNCAGCIDACDDIMESIGKPRGLIRYDSEQRFHGEGSPMLRPRVIAYTAVISTLLLILVTALLSRKPFDTHIVRRPMSQAYFEMPDGRLSNALFLQVSNKTVAPLSFEITPAPALPRLDIVIPNSPAVIPPRTLQTFPMIVNFPRELLSGGKRRIEIVVVTSSGSETKSLTLLGPDTVANLSQNTRAIE